MVKDIIDDIKKTENNSKELEIKALKDKKALIETTKSTINSLYESAEHDRKMQRQKILEQISKENKSLLENAIEEGKKLAENLSQEVSSKKPQVIESTIKQVI